MAPDVLFLNSFLWDSPVPSSGKRLAVGLAERRRVLYVEPAQNVVRVGLRTSVRQVGERMWLYSRWRLPVHFTRRLPIAQKPAIAVNRVLATAHIASAARQLGLVRPLICNALVPGVGTDLADRVGARAVVYLARDGLEATREPQLYALHEDQWIQRAAAVLCASEALMERFRDRAARVELLPNAADVHLFDIGAQLREPDLIAGTSRPRAAYAGTIDHRCDVELLRSVADVMPLVVLGASTDSTLLARLVSHRNIRYIGAVRQIDVAAYLGHADVLLMPYADVPATRMVTFPNKLYEYLATGRPVVCSRLPSFEPIAGLVTLAGPAEFAAAAVDAARHGSVGSEERVANARANSWEARTAQLNALLDEITTPDD